MDKQSVEIMYKLADGKRVRLEVSIEVKDLLAQADRQIRSQRRQDRRRHTEYVDGLTDTTTVLPQKDFADLVDRMDSYKRLYAAIEKLTETQRRRVILHYLTRFFKARQDIKRRALHCIRNNLNTAYTQITYFQEEN